MKQFYIIVTETLRRPVVVAAETQEEAEQKAIDAYDDGKFVLDSSDFIEVNFETKESDLVDALTETDWLNLTYIE